MSRTPRNLAVPLLAATVLLLAACGSSSEAAAGTGADQKDAAQSGGLPGEHVHGVARDPGDGTLYLATHEGLFRYDKGTPVRVGPVVDLMGFSVAGPGHFYASGHPGDGVDLPAPVGLMETRDAGATWTTGNGRVDSAQAISASQADGGTLEVLLVTNSGVQRSVDSGASFSPLV